MQASAWVANCALYYTTLHTPPVLVFHTEYGKWIQHVRLSHSDDFTHARLRLRARLSISNALKIHNSNHKFLETHIETHHQDFWKVSKSKRLCTSSCAQVCDNTVYMCAARVCIKHICFTACILISKVNNYILNNDSLP